MRCRTSGGRSPCRAADGRFSSGSDLDVATTRTVISSVNMNPKTRSVLLSLIVLCTAFNLSAATRYIVGLRGPLRSAKVPMVRDADLAETHDVRRFENFNSFAAELTAEEVTELRASRDVRYVE